MRNATALFALALAQIAATGPARAADPEAAPAAETYPYVEGELELTLGDDYVFSSDDPGNEINDLFPEGALTVKLGLTQIFSVNLGLTLEEVRDPDPFEDRYFHDVGLYVDTLNLQADLGDFTIVAGKFEPNFGRAWDNTPGIHGTDFAEDYELAEQIGFGGSYKIKTVSFGTQTIGAALFYADNSGLSESIFTNRGRNSRFDGGAGNTGKLNNFTISLDGDEFEQMPGFSYHLAYRHLSASFGDLASENGFVGGVAKETELSNGMVFCVNGEVGYFANYGGTLDDALYVTSGVSLANGPWHGELAGTLRHFAFDGGGNQNDLLAQLSGGYTFDNGIDLSLGYAFARDAGVDSHLVGLRLTKSFEFSTR